MACRARVVLGVGLLAVVSGWGDAPVYVPGREEPRVAIDNVCAWPELVLREDGSLVAFVHNQPSHLRAPADVDCWASEDDGLTWAFRGTPAPRDHEGAARGHIAAGQSAHGDLVVITTGYAGPFRDGHRGRLLEPWISHSRDGGRTWTIDKEGFPRSLQGWGPIPYGDIIQGEGGLLLMTGYDSEGARVFRSQDGGWTWGEPAVLDDARRINETALIHAGEGRYLAAARTYRPEEQLWLYASDDNGRNWVSRGPLTGRRQHPGHLTRLADGRLLLSYGNRLGHDETVSETRSASAPIRGVEVRFSEDDGQTWSRPFRVVDFSGDGGYPSSVQLADGRVATVYYAARTAYHNRYHMGIVLWDPAGPASVP